MLDLLEKLFLAVEPCPARSDPLQNLPSQFQTEMDRAEILWTRPDSGLTLSRFLQAGNTCQSWTKGALSVDWGDPIVHGHFTFKVQATIPHSPICAQVFRAKPLSGFQRLQCWLAKRLCTDWGMGNSGLTVDPPRRSNCARPVDSVGDSVGSLPCPALVSLFSEASSCFLVTIFDGFCCQIWARSACF